MSKMPRDLKKVKVPKKSPIHHFDFKKDIVVRDMKHEAIQDGCHGKEYFQSGTYDNPAA